MEALFIGKPLGFSWKQIQRHTDGSNTGPCRNQIWKAIREVAWNNCRGNIHVCF